MSFCTSDLRFLIRLQHQGTWQPSAHAACLAMLKTLPLAAPASLSNLRISSYALEFDLFAGPSRSCETFAPAWPLPLLHCRRLVELPKPLSETAAMEEARNLFNQERFWEVHEVLEGLWKSKTGREKALCQGLIIACAALVHFQKNETAVAWRMVADAEKRLAGAEIDLFGWPLKDFRGLWSEQIKTGVFTPFSV